MTGSSMFAQFVDILSRTFQMIFLPKYLFMFLGVGCCIGVSVVRMIMRWFNA